MTDVKLPEHRSSFDFPSATPFLERFGLKFSDGGAHISRTMMLAELELVLAAVPAGSVVVDYRNAILHQNVLGKPTDATRKKSLRHLHELYALDESTSIFGLLRRLYAVDLLSLPLLAFQVAWARDPFLRATTDPVLNASEGDHVVAASLLQAFEAAFPERYAEVSRNTTVRNTASSWTQSGHLVGRTNKVRRHVVPSVTAVTMALFLGDTSGYHGMEVFSNPWCRLLDLSADQARTRAFDAHRAGLLTLRALGEIVELSFPLFAELQLQQT